MSEFELRENVAVPYERVRRAILFAPVNALAGAQRDPTTSFEATIGDLRVAVQVKIEIGAFHEEEDPLPTCSRRFTVSAQSHPGWYPILEAALHADKAGAVTAVSLGGRYRPPGGALGRALDAAKLHEVAEISIATYFDEIVQRLGDL